MAELHGPLADLLRRCHPDELAALSRQLDVDPKDLGLADLAERLDLAIRERSSHVLEVRLSRGGAQGWGAVVKALLQRLGLPAEADLELAELRVLEWWIEETWADLGEHERDRRWGLMGLERPTPRDGAEAISTARGSLMQRLGRGAKQAAVGLGAALWLGPIAPLAGVVGAVYYATRPEVDTIVALVLEVARLRQLVRHRVTVGVVGSPSSGKDAAIGAVFGIDTGNVDPVAGSTTEVSIQLLPGPTALYVVNTPGLGDVVESVSEEALQVLHHIDVYLYVVNAQGGVQARELEDYQRCVAMGRPVLAVVNKIDTLRPRDRERYLHDARAKLGAPAEDFLAAAFDPLPQLSDVPMGVAEVQGWLQAHLVELGKDANELPWVALDGAGANVEASSS